MRNVLGRTGLIALVASLAVTLLTSCDPPPPKLYGMHGDYTWDVSNSRISSSLDAEAAFGSDISRNTLRWNVTEPTQGTHNWSKTDFVVDEAVARGLAVMLVVRDAPRWASGSSNPRSSRAQLLRSPLVSRYKAFAAVQRYGNRVKYWEVWTEPNENYYWQPSGLSHQADQARWIDMYAQLYRDTRAYVRQVNTTVELAVGAITGIGAGCCIYGTTFLNALIDRGLVFDHLAFNPHANRNQAPWDCIAFTQSFCDVGKIRTILVDRGRSNVKLWATEFGWQVGGFTTTGTTVSKLRVPGNAYRLALWNNSGQVSINGVTKNYSSITRTASYNDINLTSPLSALPALNSEVGSAQADTRHAQYVREAIKMLRGTYVPAGSRPPQNYSYVQIGIYFRTSDIKTETWGMYGLMHEPLPNYNQPGTWFLQGKPAAGSFMQETD
ncbi:MAG: hypothetical protein WKF43_00265 [Acidimicrobiales bacterium]